MAGATDIDYPSLEEVVSSSSRIARVKILEHERATYMDEGEQKDCGVVYTAQVLESLKGDETEFRFLAATDQDFAGTEREYLVFALEAKALGSVDVDESDAAWVRCRIESAPFLLSERTQVMIPFTKGAGIASSRERLQITRASAISTLPVEEAEIGGKPYGFVEWAAAKSAILTVIAREPRLISRAPRSR